MTNTSVFGSNGIGGIYGLGQSAAPAGAYQAIHSPPPATATPRANYVQNADEARVAASSRAAYFGTILLAIGVSAGAGAVIAGREHRKAGAIGAGIIGGLVMTFYL
jgi:hypothetical protein